MPRVPVHRQDLLPPGNFHRLLICRLPGDQSTNLYSDFFLSRSHTYPTLGIGTAQNNKGPPERKEKKIQYRDGQTKEIDR